MNYTDVLAGQAEWAAKNMAYNLDFIAPDKLDWKPAPTAKSALDIVNHVVAAIRSMKSLLEEGNYERPNFQHPDFTPATTADEAKTLLVTTAGEYAQSLRAVKPEDLGKDVNLPFGTMPLARVVSMPVIDLVHHHGQIAYIQTLLGDTEPHFDRSMF
jgi:uncharacterized damage-inducible protein DinB